VARNVADSRWHADETRWLVFEELEGKAGHKWYLWAFLSSSTVVFKLDPSCASEVPMDNNRAERAQRPQVVGRKNYYGSGARWSGELAAMLFSLLQTLLLWNINPRGWLSGYLGACAEIAGNAPPEAEQWLPWNLSETRQLELQQRQARARDGP